MAQGSLVMQAWHQYTGRIKESNEQSRRVPRLPGATGIYLSEATGCPRKASLRLLKYPAAKRNDYQNTALAAGIKGEEKIILVLEACGWEIQRQYVLQTKYGNGKIDALVNGDESAPLIGTYINRPIVIEIKTTTIDQHKNLPFQSHVDQCLLYMGLIATEDGQVPHGEVTYLLKQAHDKDDGDKVDSFVVMWNQARYEDLISKLDLIDVHVRKGIPVPLDLCGDVRPDKPPCQYPRAGKCQYWQHCYENGNNIQPVAQHIMEF